MQRVILSFVSMLMFSAIVWGQATAQIAGTVRDESGAVIPGTEIKVTQTATGASRTTTSNEEGQYIFPTLPLGPYVLEATRAGFTSYMQTGIVLQVDSRLNIDIPLKLGSIGQEVTVEANVTQVEARSTGISQVVDNLRVSEMPLNGRNPVELVNLVPGVRFVGRGGNDRQTAAL